MSKRISHSLLDPLMIPRIPALYRRMHIPRWLPPEAIVGIGHVVAIVGAVGFALSTQYAWGGLLIALGVAGNHLADMVDGTHARTTGQCRNGGELLDHFTDPLSFAYWMIGLGVSITRLDLALAGVVAIFATAVLTNIRAKITGEFTLARFGPTEFKALLVLYGLTIAAATIWATPQAVMTLATIFTITLVGVGVIQLVLGLITSVRAVNACGKPADTTNWQLETSLTGEHAASTTSSPSGGAPSNHTHIALPGGIRRSGATSGGSGGEGGCDGVGTPRFVAG